MNAAPLLERPTGAPTRRSRPTRAQRHETFHLLLSPPVGATISDTSGTATIVNDDQTRTKKTQDRFSIT